MRSSKQAMHCCSSLKKLLAFAFFFLVSWLHAQKRILSGVIQDRLRQPISNAHIIAIPMSSDVHTTFSISDTDGNYQIKLFKNQEYRIMIHHLGYQLSSIRCNTDDNDMQRNVSLLERTHDLDEVLIQHTLPMVFKKDTIRFRADAFASGNEAKLRDLLKKLPMLEVDRYGNVSVQGKKVNKLLVENKEFFTGDSKLAVNNIPADVVDTIEVLENYNEIAFLKGLEDSDAIAINIQLKENKKRFVFGDVAAGAGMKNRYLLHPSLYYYSPNTTMNSIGDFNNTGVKSFTFKDFLEFEGDISALLNNAKSYFSFLNDSFEQFSGNQEVTANTHNFGALSLAQTINNNLDLSTYAIWSKTRNTKESQIRNTYFSSDDLIENRSSKGEQTNEFGIGSFQLKLKPNTNTDITFRTFVKASHSNSQENTASITADKSHGIQMIRTAHNLSFKKGIQWHQKINEQQTFSTLFKYHYQKATPITHWLTDETIFHDLIPIQNGATYDISKIKKICSHTINATMKYYWLFNRMNHIHVSMGTQIALDHLETSQYQKLEDGTTHGFSGAGFENDTRLHYQELFVGVHYKAQKGKMTLTPGFFYHYYHWRIAELNQKLRNKKAIFLPELVMNIEFNSMNKLHFKYDLNAKFPSVSQLSEGRTIANFNSIYQGNSQLKNELYHHFHVRYNRFSMFKDLWYHWNLSYRVKEANFKNAIHTEGIDIMASPILSDFEDKAWMLRGNLKKGIGISKVSLFGDLRIAQYEKPINNELLTYTSNQYTVGSSIETSFHNSLTLEAGYTKSISEYNANTSSVFQTDVISAYVAYTFLKDFSIKADYSFEKYSNKAIAMNSNFDVANASLFYQKEDSPWTFEIRATNIFDIAFKQRNSLSSVLVSDEKTFILPRMCVFKVSYTL